MRRELVIESDMSELDRVRSEVREFIKDLFDAINLNRVVLSVDEALANIIEHAYPPESTETISLTMERKPDRVVFELRDEGPPFDPTRLGKPDLDSLGRNTADGGLGVFLYTTLMEASYRRDPTEANVLTLVRRLETAA